MKTAAFRFPLSRPKQFINVSTLRLASSDKIAVQLVTPRQQVVVLVQWFGPDTRVSFAVENLGDEDWYYLEQYLRVVDQIAPNTGGLLDALKFAYKNSPIPPEILQNFELAINCIKFE